MDKPRFTSEHVEDRADGRRVVFQLRDWVENENQYHAHQFLIKSVDGEYTLKH